MKKFPKSFYICGMWSENMEKHEKLLDMLMDFNENVRYAAVCDIKGKILWQSKRNTIKNILPLADTKKTVKRAITSWNSRNQITEKVGRGMYAIAAYEKIKRVTIPLDKKHMLFLSLDNKPQNNKGYGRLAPMGKIMSIVDFVTVS